MPRRKAARVPAAARKTLLEWIELDDGNTTESSMPACDKQVQALHARIALDPGAGAGETPEPLPPPLRLRLPPLG